MFKFKHLIWFSAISIALVAAFFSVTGIATLFSGKFWAVFVMATALEIGKLVAASFLYRYWKTTPGVLKTYMSIGVVILMLVTSMGIYGYLSAAYAEIAAVPQNTINQISAIDTRQSTLNDNVQRMQADNTSLETRRSQVQTSLDNVLEGNTDLSQRSAFANLRTEIEQLDVERRGNLDDIALQQSERDSLENVKVQLNADLNTNSDIGTFIYISRTLGVPLDTVVKWFVLVIVFVFDPLAMSLILAYNSIAIQEQPRGPPPKKAETVTKVRTQHTKYKVPDLTEFKAGRGVLTRYAKKILGQEKVEPIPLADQEMSPEEEAYLDEVIEDFEREVNKPEQTMEEFIDHVPSPEKQPDLKGYVPARDIIESGHVNVYGEEMPGILASEKIIGKAEILKGPRKGSIVHVVGHEGGSITAIYTDPSTGVEHRFKAAEAKFGPIQLVPIETGWSFGSRLEPPRS